MFRPVSQMRIMTLKIFVMALWSWHVILYLLLVHWTHFRTCLITWLDPGYHGMLRRRVSIWCMPLLHQFDRKSPWLQNIWFVFCVTKFKHSDEDEILPTAVTSLLQIPVDTHYSIRAAVLRLLSQLGGWIKEHHEMLGMELWNYTYIPMWNLHTSIRLRLSSVKYLSINPIVLLWIN